MKLYQLSYFCAVNKYGGFRNAAKNLGIAQSSITEAIRKLEDEWEVSLFERDKKGISLTEEGEYALKKCENIINEIDEMQNQLQIMKAAHTQTVRICFDQLLDIPINALTEFSAAYPEYHLDIKTRGGYHIISNLKHGEYDICFTFADYISEGLKYQSYGQVEFGVCFSKNHPFEKLDSIPASFLSRYRILFDNEIKVVEKRFEKYCEQNSVQVGREYASSVLDPQIYSYLLSGSDFLVLLPVPFLKKNDQILMKKLDPPFYLDLAVIWRQEEYEPRTIQTAIKFFTKRK